MEQGRRPMSRGEACMGVGRAVAHDSAEDLGQRAAQACVEPRARQLAALDARCLRCRGAKDVRKSVTGTRNKPRASAAAVGAWPRGGWQVHMNPRSAALASYSLSANCQQSV